MKMRAGRPRSAAVRSRRYPGKLPTIPDDMRTNRQILLPSGPGGEHVIHRSGNREQFYAATTEKVPSYALRRCRIGLNPGNHGYDCAVPGPKKRHQFRDRHSGNGPVGAGHRPHVRHAIALGQPGTALSGRPDRSSLLRHRCRKPPARQAGVIDDQVLGSPVENMRDIPAGEYFVQALFNVYTRFQRSDGKVVWMHQDQWEGQNWKRSPGNIYSEVMKLTIDPAKGWDDKFDRRIESDFAGSDPIRYEVCQAHQDPERDSHEVLGTADVSGRRSPAAGRL